MDITFRTLGAWGAGKGANLEAGEVDSNFWSLAQAIVDLQSNPAQPNGIASITVSGTQMTIYLTDGTVMGPFTLPVLTFRWRGEYDGALLYAVLDVFTISTGNPWIDPATVRYGIFMVQIAGTYGDFDPDAIVGGEPVFLQLFGAVDNATLSNLADVDITTGPFPNDVLVWDAVAGDDGEGAWVNQNLGDMAFQFSNSVHISGGSIGGLPAPALPGDAATKAYVDAMPAGMMVADRTMMANISGLTGPALANTLSDFLDYALLTSARGTMLYRGAAGWVALAPGTAGLFLKTAGAGADPTWSVGGSGVTSVAAGAGITTGGSPITATGSVALASVADNSLLANITGSSAAPSAATLSAFLDHVASSTRGAILTRAGSGWVALAPGTSGYYLQTQGATADAVWSSPSGSGTVTSISAGTGISTGGAPITGAGTVSLATIGNASVLANISGSSSAPVPATVSVLFDSVFGATQGAVIYRNATTWVMLPPGTSGQVLTTGGASANPAWANAAAGAPIANLLLLSNISGSTAAPSGNSLSNIFDAILGSSRGMLVYRGASGWVALSAGTTGDVLTTGGVAGDPHWAATAAGASISVGDSAPSSPSVGDAWWDSLGGQLYIRYDDGTSSQWVPASNQPGPAGATGPTGPTGATGATGPAGSANMSGMTAGQIPIAATATTIISSGNLSGAVTTSGSLATTLANNAVATANITNANVTYAKIQNVAANRLLGNATGSAAAPAEIALPLSLANGGTGTTNAAGLPYLPIAGGTLSGSLAVGGNGNPSLDIYGGQFTALHAPDATGLASGIFVGLLANPVNYYANGTHGFYDRAMATNYVTMAAAGTTVGAPTGGAKGAGTLNAVGVYAQGTVLTSDASLKTDIESLPEHCLDLVSSVEPKRYRWRLPEPDELPLKQNGEGRLSIDEFRSPGFYERARWGFVAQDIEAVIGAAVEEDAEGIQGYDPAAMVAVLWQAVRELAAEVAALRAERRT